MYSEQTKQKIKEIYGALPKLDDQQCGYRTCGEFARAVAEGRAPCNGCVTGGLLVAEKVCEIMETEVLQEVRGRYPKSRIPQASSPNTGIGITSCRGMRLRLHRRGRGMGWGRRSN